MYPVHVAAAGADVRMLQATVKMFPHASRLLRDSEGWLPIHHAAASATDADALTVLINAGVDVAAEVQRFDLPEIEFEWHSRYQPIHIAARRGRLDFVSKLVEHKASVSATTGDRYPMDLALALGLP